MDRVIDVRSREMWTGAVGGTNGRMAAPGLPCLSNLVYDGTMFIYDNNGPKGPDAGEEVGLEHLPPHVDLMIAVVHYLKIGTYLFVMASHTTSIHSTINSHIVFM